MSYFTEKASIPDTEPTPYQKARQDEREIVLQHRTAKDYMREFKAKHPEVIADAPQRTASGASPAKNTPTLEPALLQKAA